MSITDIQDARAMRRTGATLNTPVELRVFNPVVSKHWLKLAKAESKLDAAIFEYTRGSRAGTLSKFNFLKRRNEALFDVAENALGFAMHFNEDPAQQFILCQLTGQALDVVNWWRQTFSDCERGAQVEIALADIPRVFPLDR